MAAANAQWSSASACFAISSTPAGPMGTGGQASGATRSVPRASRPGAACLGHGKAQRSQTGQTLVHADDYARLLVGRHRRLLPVARMIVPTQASVVSPRAAGAASGQHCLRDLADHRQPAMDAPAITRAEATNARACGLRSGLGSAGVTATRSRRVVKPKRAPRPDRAQNLRRATDSCTDRGPLRHLSITSVVCLTPSVETVR
jgi:hypothetical protein